MTTEKRETLSAIKLALLADRLRERDDDLRLLASEPIAIVGLACRMPGGIQSPDELWDFLAGGGDAITEVPESRWDAEALFDSDVSRAGKINTKFGGFLERVDLFDPIVFGIAPKEAVYIDPQHRLLLEVAWEACDDAGLPLDSLRGTDTGVFFSLYSADYGRRQLAHPADISAHTISGTSASMAAGRLSYLFDLRGPSMVIDTACSASLVAVHEAARSLRERESGTAIVGGASLLLAPEETISLARWGMLAPDGRCKTFDESADGFVRSEGCGVIVLKRLSDALKNNDPIRAVIRGSAVNQDGRSSVLTAPNGAAQREVIRAAQRTAGVHPYDVTYVEAHGTGTKVGDPIEVDALLDVLGCSNAERPACFVGSIKANVGHLEAAAGVASLIKTVLCLERAQIPGQIHLRQINSLMPIQGTRLSVPTSLVDWKVAHGSRIAGVSSFGFSGTNAHLIVEESPVLPRKEPESARAQLLPLSAKSPDALLAFREVYQRFLESPASSRLSDIAYTASVRRSHQASRSFVVADDVREAQAQMRSPVLASTVRQIPPKIAFVYSGQGSGWIGMGRALYRDEPAFAREIDRCDNAARAWIDWSIADTFAADGNQLAPADTERYQVILFCLQHALTEMWRGAGIEPAAVVGHSVGEVAAARAAGALSLETAIELVVMRARFMQDEAFRGAMAAIGVSREQAETEIAPWRDSVVVAAINSSESVTVSGDADSIAALCAAQEAAGRFVRLLDVERAFHSPYMSKAGDLLADALGGIATAATTVPLYSTVTGNTIAGQALDAKYWRRNLCEPVDFAAAVRKLLEDGFDTFIEVGPHPALLPNIATLAGDVELLLLPTMRREVQNRRVWLESLGALYVAGCDLDWKHLSDSAARCVPLPAYVWQRARYWFEPESAATGMADARNRQGRRIDSPFFEGVLHEVVLGPESPSWLCDHRLTETMVVPGVALFDLALRAAADALGRADGFALYDGIIKRPLVVAEDRTVQVLVQPLGESRWRIRIASRIAAGTDGSWQEHFECATGPTDVPGPQVCGNGLPTGARSCKEVDTALYERMFRRGINFGTQFRKLSSVEGAGKTRVARLIDEQPPGESAHALYPPRFDAALHALESFYPDDDKAWLPIAFSSLVLVKSGASISAAEAQLLGDSATGSASDLKFDVSLLTGDHALAARLEGLHLRSVDAEKLERLLTEGADGLLHRLVFESAPGSRHTADSGGVRLVFCDSGGLGHSVGAAPGEHSSRTIEVLRGTEFRAVSNAFHVDPSQPEHFERLLSEVRRDSGEIGSIAFLWPLDASASDPVDAQGPVGQSLTALLRALSAKPSPVWLHVVTRGAAQHMDLSGCAQAAAWGIGAVAAHELPIVSTILVDLDPSDSAAEQADALREELEIRDGENRIAWSGGHRFAQRLRPLESVSIRAGQPPEWQLRPASTSVIGDLAPRSETLPKPADGEIRIEPAAVGLNFRDVMNALGMLDDRAPLLGAECAGRVVEVGPGVDPGLLGTDVMAFAIGSFASSVVVNAHRVWPVPKGMGLAEAASIPVAFLTARYGLDSLAAVGPEDTVLIHAASGGVGLAAVQVAANRGATVFATAGSERKRDFLRELGIECVMSSRDLDFREEILERTGGRGVDVVVNTLADEFVAASVDALRRGGQFIELGKRGIWSTERMESERPDVRFLPFDLSTVAAAEPEVIAGLFASLGSDFAEGRLHPLPMRSFEFGMLSDAFDHMSRARHIGKIVVRMPDRRRDVRGDLSYLITGASGAVARHLVRALVDSGARYLALVARREADTGMLEFSESVHDSGAVARWFRADVADRESLAEAVTAIAEDASLPPLGGIFHLAAVVDDAPLATMDWQRARAILMPKMRGAWNLHELSLDRGIDCLVFYASVAGVLGWPGQAAYAAANAYLDALARWRSTRGLPAVAIDWGPWEGAGLAARTEAERGIDFAAGGFRPIAVGEAAGIAGTALSAESGQLIAAWMDSERLPAGSLTPRSSPPTSDRTKTELPFSLRIAEVPEERQLALVEEIVRFEAAKALGLGADFRIDATRPLNEIGLDSLLSVQLANALGAVISRPLSATLVFDYPTIKALVQALAGELKIGASPVPDALDEKMNVADIDDLSEEEAEAMLLNEISRSRDG
jgi:acyl transferase domain-containing protein/NADPH:quinone reductase-like Zn-dependent oxidoreductase